MIIEARTAGQDDWTTLPDANGGSSAEEPTECHAGFLLNLHPFVNFSAVNGPSLSTQSATPIRVLPRGWRPRRESPPPQDCGAGPLTGPHMGARPVASVRSAPSEPHPRQAGS
ncbi:hypothetical protein GCM10010390_01530 [Streptomyces mordarskii]|uniref:Uncharacterized protein n=1 Tax=Streptomyces mordarskii TaxID=1226758 RepID=A0ABP3LKG8_9ACTN